jgi:UDPglucose 6-dehydrogenase
MKICVIGTGYVGLVTGVCLADSGNDVICVDIDQKKIQELNQGKPVIYEPGLEEIMLRNYREKRLEFSSDINYAVRNSKIIFIAVGTPQDKDGSADLTYVLKAAMDIARAMNGYKIIVTKSTVPVGTGKKIINIIKKYSKHKFDYISNPEFLKEGTAIDDFMKPDRVVLGGDSKKALEIMRELYSPFVRTGKPILTMDILSAEMTKYAANVFLATRISCINEIANLCEKIGADVDSVRIGIGTDARIGMHFLFPGLGYGGSCFPKDVKAMIKTGRQNKQPLLIFEAVDRVNSQQWKNITNKIKLHFKNNLRDKTFAVWGLSFKPRTDDVRESPAIKIITSLLTSGTKIRAFDPVAIKEAKKVLGDKILYFDNQYDAVKDADGLIIATEWNEFRRPDFTKIKKMMKSPVIFDGRNIYEVDKMREMGFKYYSIGRKNV